MRFKRTKKSFRGFKLNVEQYLLFQSICAFYNVSVSAVLDEFIKNYNNLHSHVLNTNPLERSFHRGGLRQGKSETIRQEISNLPGIREI